MKLPNGYGSVYRLKGNRRKPYAVRVTKGYIDGKQKREIIGYTKTKEEGLILLAEYNKNPWDKKSRCMTFSEVFELWKENNFLSEATQKSYANKYKNYCQSLYDIPYSELRTYHFNKVIQECKLSNGTKNIIRKLFRALDKTALEYEIIAKGYSEFVHSFTEEKSERKPFTEKEIEKLWNHLSDPDVDIVLIYIYTGFRRQELVDIPITDIDLENNTIKGGAKTKAGKNRLVPIHPRILPLIKNRIEKSKNGKLFPFGSKALAEHFRNCMKRMEMEHVLHECRHTLRTRLDNAGANKTVIDMIMGHSSGGVGERIYTHKTIEQLQEAMSLIE